MQGNSQSPFLTANIIFLAKDAKGIRNSQTSEGFFLSLFFRRKGTKRIVRKKAPPFRTGYAGEQPRPLFNSQYNFSREGREGFKEEPVKISFV
jgi:hypothetical protein